MANLTPTQLATAARSVGLHVTTWSPSDGATRYRFSHDDTDYFACEPLFTALGLGEAVTYWRGYQEGRMYPDGSYVASRRTMPTPALERLLSDVEAAS